MGKKENMITTNDIQGLIAFVITNNKPGLIQAMNNTGNFVALNISDNDLYNKVWDVFSKSGITGLQDVLSRVRIDHSKITQEQARVILTKFKDIDPNAKFGDFIGQVGDFFGGLLGGHSVTAPIIQQMTSISSISPGMIGLIVVIGIILMILFRKFIGVVVGIVVIVFAVILYGIFAKNITTTSTGGGSTSSGGIGAAILAFFTGK